MGLVIITKLVHNDNIDNNNNNSNSNNNNNNNNNNKNNNNNVVRIYNFWPILLTHSSSGATLGMKNTSQFWICRLIWDMFIFTSVMDITFHLVPNEIEMKLLVNTHTHIKLCTCFQNMVISAQPYAFESIDLRTGESDHSLDKLICLTLYLVFYVGFYKNFKQI